jgi:hypothetical protein
VYSVYRVIQEERSIFWEVTVRVIVTKSSYEYESNYDWLPRQNCLNLQIQKYCEL